ncbi:MAG: efflux RND transporter periplasmic adaptor subunit [Pseudomonadota bacterium]
MLVIVIGVSSLRAAGADEAAQSAQPISVEVFTVDYREQAEITELFPGLITARRESALGFERGGRIAEIGVDVGDQVLAGDRLAQLDTRTLRAQLAAARAEASAMSAQADLTDVTLNRQRQLVEQGHISPQRLDEAEANAAAAHARRAAAEANADALAVQLELAELNAPFDGVITARTVDEGVIASPGAAIVYLTEAGALELRVGLPAREAERLEAGRAYRALVAGRSVEARLRAQTGVVDRQSRTVTAIFDLDAEAAAVGEVARLELPAALDEAGFWTPVSALAEGRRGLWAVYVLTGESRPYTLEPRSVEILHTEGGRAYVRGAVRDGDRAISAGLQRVTPGQLVSPASEG